MHENVTIITRMALSANETEESKSPSASTSAERLVTRMPLSRLGTISCDVQDSLTTFVENLQSCCLNGLRTSRIRPIPTPLLGFCVRICCFLYQTLGCAQVLAV